MVNTELELKSLGFPFPEWEFAVVEKSFDGLLEGSYVLLYQDSIEIIWNQKPVCDPYWGWADEAIDLSEDAVLDKQLWNYMLGSEDLRDACRCIDLEVAVELYNQCLAQGYDRDQHGFLSAWLAHSLGALLKSQSEGILGSLSGEKETHYACV